MPQGKKNVEEKRYAILSTQSVLAYAEAAGHSDISEEIAAVLSEDVVYRLREVIQNTCQFMLHAKRKRMTSNDFNMALRNMDVQPICGYGATEPLKFRQTLDGGLHFVDDAEVNLTSVATSKQVPSQQGSCTLKAEWLVVEGTQKKAETADSKQTVKNECGLSPDHLAYYERVTCAILSSDEQLTKLALIDLRTNSKISQILPYFIHFISNGVKTLCHDVGRLTCLLHMVRALTCNRSIYLQPRPYLELLVGAVLYCAIEPVAASDDHLADRWALRDYAARLIASILRKFSTPINQLHESKLNTLREILYDLGRPFCSHYGAVMALAACGTQAIEEILLPHLHTYWRHLSTAMENAAPTEAQNKTDAFKVYGAILLAAEFVMLTHRCTLLNSIANVDSTQPATESACSQKNNLANSSSIVKEEVTDNSHPSSPDRTRQSVSYVDAYKQLHYYFGDALAAKLPIATDLHTYRRSVVTEQTVVWEEPMVTFSDEHSHKPGEQLLEEMMSAPESTPVQSSSKIAEQSIDTEEYCEEKSERSERSSRSERSERSHSDESLSFLDDTDLTVKATVSDPTFGIKLTIAKRPKARAAAAASPDASCVTGNKKRRSWGQGGVVAAFGKRHSPIARSHQKRFQFRLEGCDMKCGVQSIKQWQRRSSLTPIKSEYSNLSKRAKPTGCVRPLKRDSFPPPASQRTGLSSSLVYSMALNF